MALALQLAEKGQYTARPNPMVGCVIVKKGEIVGQGWHQKFGEPHAEINALQQAGDDAKDSTCYVTLEPCSHTGKTGPCAEALVQVGISRVVVAMEDPNPKVSGKGFDILSQAGITVECGLLKEQAQQLNRGFISKFERRRPWISIKLAMSLDGRTALTDGSSKWITGPEARLDVQKLRAKQDAILTGIGTLKSDNPSMTVRAEERHSNEEHQGWFNQLDSFQQPTRILLDRNAEASLDSKFFNQDAPVWWVTNGPDAEQKLKQVERETTQILRHSSLKKLSEYCAQQGMNQLLVESGHRLAGQFFQQNLVDEVIVYIAPKLMGNDAFGLFDLQIDKMSQCPELRLKDIRQLGDDIRLIYSLAQ